jgi:NADPH:quinone reductase-like Zn-dependent oxidoreductase
MKRLSVTGKGGIESLSFTDVPIPEPRPGEVVVKVAAASLNHRDLTMANLKAPGTPTTPFTPMSDCAGTVHAVGSEVAELKVGDRVTSLFFQRWMSGPVTQEVRWETVPSERHQGVAAEYVTLLAQGVYAAPATLSDEEASTLPCAALTAWRAMFEDARLDRGARVLIQGTGGVAIFALQFATAMGMEAIITSSSDVKLARARELGAAHIVNYREHPQWGAEVKRLVGRSGVDFVLGVGGAGIEEVLPLRTLVGKNARLQGVSVGSREMYARMAAMIEKYGVKPVIDCVYPFHDAVGAFRALERGGHFGKIVIEF